MAIADKVKSEGFICVYFKVLESSEVLEYRSCFFLTEILVGHRGTVEFHEQISGQWILLDHDIRIENHVHDPFRASAIQNAFGSRTDKFRVGFVAGTAH